MISLRPNWPFLKMLGDLSFGVGFMIRSSLAAIGLAALLAPSFGYAQEMSPVDEAGAEMVAYLKSVGFADAAIAAVGGNEGDIILQGIKGHKTLDGKDVSLEVAKAEIAGLDPGYRWTKATSLRVEGIRYSVGNQTYTASALQSINFGVLDIDSARPGIAFDSLSLTGFSWASSSEKFLDIPRLESTASSWQENYSVPASLKFAGNLILSPSLLARFDIYRILPGQGRPLAVELGGNLFVTTSASNATVKVNANTDRLGDHSFGANISGIDDGLLRAFFGLQDEAIAGDAAKRKVLEDDLAANQKDIRLKTAYYEGSNLSWFRETEAALADKTKQPVDAVQRSLGGLVYGWISARTSPDRQDAVVKPIYEAVHAFLQNPETIQLELVPQKGAAIDGLLSQSSGTGEPPTGKLLDDLGLKARTQ